MEYDGLDDGRPPERHDDLLRRLLKLSGADPGKRPPLAQLLREARAYGLRRADRLGGRDNLIYRLGYALDALGFLSANADRIAGVLSSPPLLAEILTSQPLEEGGISLISLIERSLQRPDIALWAENEGRRAQWERLRELYEQQIEVFKESEAYMDPNATWRGKLPTRPQRYLIGEIVRLTGSTDPSCKTRWEAFCFIEEAGGNPRFRKGPKERQRPTFGA
jgi:hypothetical protein